MGGEEAFKSPEVELKEETHTMEEQKREREREDKGSN